MKFYLDGASLLASMDKLEQHKATKSCYISALVIEEVLWGFKKDYEKKHQLLKQIDQLRIFIDWRNRYFIQFQKPFGFARGVDHIGRNDMQLNLLYKNIIKAPTYKELETLIQEEIYCPPNRPKSKNVEEFIKVMSRAPKEGDILLSYPPAVYKVMGKDMNAVGSFLLGKLAQSALHYIQKPELAADAQELMRLGKKYDKSIDLYLIGLGAYYLNKINKVKMPEKKHYDIEHFLYYNSKNSTLVSDDPFIHFIKENYLPQLKLLSSAEFRKTL